MRKNSRPPSDRSPRPSDGVNRRQVLFAATGLAVSLTPVPATAADGESWYEAIFRNNREASTAASRKKQQPSIDDSDLSASGVPLVSKAMLERFDTAIQQYEQIVKEKNWTGLKRGRFLRAGSRHQTIATVRSQLIATGDYKGPLPTWPQDDDYFDDGLATALKVFQQRHGLRITGRLDRSTRHQLSYGAKDRLRQLKRNRQRLVDLLNTAKSQRYVLVNIPGYQLEAVANGEVERRHTVIVGRPDRQTPDLSATIQGVNFFPFWHVPHSIAERDLIPRARKDPEFIAEQHFRISTGSFSGSRVLPENIVWKSATAQKLKFRQDPGPWNALGLVRVNMPNKDIIYLHDTPMKHLFKQRYRAFSAGCIRVHNVMDLVAWLGSDQDELDRQSIARLIEETDAKDQSETRSQNLDVSLKRPVPVHLVYLTAWIEDNGQVMFRPDIYKRDDSRSAEPDIPADIRSSRAVTP